MTVQRTIEWSVDAAAIDRERILRGLTRRDLARKAHVDEGTLCDLFRSRRRPTFGTLRAICLILELSLTDVICLGEATGSPVANADAEAQGIAWRQIGTCTDILRRNRIGRLTV